MTGCNQNKVLNASQLIDWFQDTKNGYRIIKNANHFTFDLQLRPIEYEKALVVIQKDNTADIQQQPQEEFYFTLKIKHSSGTDLSKINTQNDINLVERNLYYLSYGMEEDMVLVEGKDTILPLYFIYEKPYNLSKYSTFNICFSTDKIDTDSDLTFLLEGDFFNTLPIKFKFSKDKIYHHPKLKNS